MSQQIEQLKHGTTLIFPRTSQEAVLINYKNKVLEDNKNASHLVNSPDDVRKAVREQFKKGAEAKGHQVKIVRIRIME